MTYAKIAGWVILAALIFWAGQRVYSSGHKAGADSIQVLWDKDRETINALAAAAVNKAVQDRDAAIQSNQVIHDAYEAKLAAEHNSALDLARRLRDAEVSLAASRRVLSQTSGGQGSTATIPSGGDDPIVVAAGAAIAECNANAAQLDALVAELNRQGIQ